MLLATRPIWAGGPSLLRSIAPMFHDWFHHLRFVIFNSHGEKSAIADLDEDAVLALEVTLEAQVDLTPMPSLGFATSSSKVSFAVERARVNSEPSDGNPLRAKLQVRNQLWRSHSHSSYPSALFNPPPPSNLDASSHHAQLSSKKINSRPRLLSSPESLEMGRRAGELAPASAI